MDYFYYRYQELRQKAVAPNATQEDVNELGRWFEAYGSRFWNGESYGIDDNLRLYPIYKQVDEDNYEIVGYEIR